MIRLLFIICLASFFALCTPIEEPENTLADAKVKTSELAVLMRKIHAEAKIIHNQLKQGNAISPATTEVFKNMVTATPTDTDVSGPDFEKLALDYQIALDSLLQSNPDLKVNNYNSLVKSCVACHEHYCPGPIPTIQKLHLKEEPKAFENL